jgi:hypothetical protein
MSALILTLADVLGNSMRILPGLDGKESNGIICRKIGPTWSRRYMVVGVGFDFSYMVGVKYAKPDDIKSCLLPKALHQMLKKPKSVGHLLAVAGRNIFPQPLVLEQVRSNRFSRNMGCQVCKAVAMSVNGEPVVTPETPEGLYLPKANNISFTLTYSGVYALATCDDHFKKNNGEILDSEFRV